MRVLTRERRGLGHLLGGLVRRIPGSSGDSGDRATGRALRASGWCSSWSSCSWSGCGCWRGMASDTSRTGPVGRRPRHLGLGLGWPSGRDLPRPELGHADVHEGRPRAGHIRPYRTIRHPIYTGILLAMIGSAIASASGADRRGTDRRVLHLQRLRGGAQHDQALPSAYPEYQQSTKMLIPYLLRTRGACWRDGPPTARRTSPGQAS